MGFRWRAEWLGEGKVEWCYKLLPPGDQPSLQATPSHPACQAGHTPTAGWEELSPPIRQLLTDVLGKGGLREGRAEWGCREGKVKAGRGNSWKERERGCGQVGKPVKMRRSQGDTAGEKGPPLCAAHPPHCRQIHLLKPRLRGCSFST